MNTIARFLRTKLGAKANSEANDKSLKVHTYLTVVLGFFLGRTLLANSIAPFGPALYAGQRALDVGLPVLTGISVILGSATLGKWDQFLYHALSIALITVFIKPGKKKRYPVVLDSFVAGLIVFFSRSAIAVAQHPSLYQYLSAFLEGLCGLITTLLSHSLFIRKTNVSKSDQANQAIIAIVLLSLGGLQGIYLSGVNVGIVIVMAGTLVTAYVGGPAAGAIAGLSGGLIAALTGNEDPLIIGLLGISGVLGGIGGWFGKLEAVLGYSSAGLIMSFYADSANAVSHRLMEQIISCGVIFLITPRVKKVLETHIPGQNLTQNIRKSPRATLEPLALKIAAVSNGLTEMGKLFSQVSGSRTAKSGAVCNDGKDQQNETNSWLVKQLADRVCCDCVQKSMCWEEEFGETYEDFCALIRKSQITGRLSMRDNSLKLSDRCQRFGEIISELNHQKEIERLEKRIFTLDMETKECLAFQYRSLGQMLNSKRTISDLSREANGSSCERKSRLKVILKGKTIPARGAEKPGDVWVNYRLGPGKTLIVLVDGMGKGEYAAKQSKNTIEILKSLLDCGLDYGSCVSFLNSALYLAWRPDGFVALDCLLIDHETERAYFRKLGAPPSFIRKKDGNVLVVRGSTPPAGALKQVLGLGTSEPVSPGDTIFLVSDGIFRSSPIPARAEHLIVSRLSRLRDNSLDRCIKALVSQSLRYQRQNPPDDITVVGALIESV